jgi:hypothetical protein
MLLQPSALIVEENRIIRLKNPFMISIFFARFVKREEKGKRESRRAKQEGREGGSW